MRSVLYYEISMSRYKEADIIRITDLMSQLPWSSLYVRIYIFIYMPIKSGVAKFV